MARRSKPPNLEASAFDAASAPAAPSTWIESVDASAIGAHRKAWSDLAARTPEPNVFLEPAFMLALLPSLPNDRKPDFLLFWNGERTATSRLRALLAIERAKPGSDPIFRKGFTHELIALGTPLFDGEEGVAAIIDMATCLAGTGLDQSALVIANVPTCGVFWSLVTRNAAASTYELESHHRAILRSTEPTSLAKRKFKELARQQRRLAEHGCLAFERTSNPDRLEDCVEHFLELEHAGWKGRRGTALACNPRHADFLRSMTREMAAEGKCHMDGLYLDGTPVAMAIVLRSGDQAYFWKTAFDERFAKSSPGVQLTLELTSRQSADPTVVATDSCAVADHPMIDGVWGARRRIADVVLLSHAVGRGRRRLLFIAAKQIEIERRRLRRSAKRMLHAMRRALRQRGIAVAGDFK